MNIKNLIKITSGIILVMLLTSCPEIKTDNPKEAYKYWLGKNPPADMELLNGYYWESAHWTKEYIVYLKFKPTDKWWNDFLELNKITIDTADWTMSSNAPAWFNPSENSIRFKRDNLDQDSRFFKDTLTDICYIFEIQF